MITAWPIVQIRLKVLSILKKHFEATILFVFASLWIYLVLVKKFPVVKTDESSFYFALEHYIYPLILALFIQALITIFSRKSAFKLSNEKNIIPVLYIPFILVTIFLHFNFKAWTPLINPKTYDLLYHELDSILPITKWFSDASSFLKFDGILSPVNLYHHLFVLMFFTSFILHLSFDKIVNFRKVVVGTCLILLLGSISYWVMPAVGPFIFTTDKITDFSPYQSHMYSLYKQLIDTRIIPDGYFINAPAAMPSLHIANTFYFLITAKRSLPRLAFPYAILFSYIVIVSVASGWHYFIDLPFGMILSIFVLYLIDKVYS